MKVTTLTVMAAAAAFTVMGCGSSHAKPHTQALAPVSAKASHVSSASDKTACLTWHKSVSAWEDGTVSAASWEASTQKATSEAGDAAFKRDAAAAVTDYKASQVMPMAQDLRSAVNDCEHDGVNVYGP